MAEKKETKKKNIIKTSKKVVEKKLVEKKAKVVEKKPVVSKKVEIKVKKDKQVIEKKEIKKSKRRILKGIVIKDNSLSHGFLKVEVTRIVPHPLYKKLIKKKKKFLVTCMRDIEISIGDKVLIEETKPISKKISFRYVSKV